MNKNRSLVVLLFGIVSFLIVFSCFGKEKQKEYEGTIGLSVLTMTNPFFKDIADNIQKEANKNGYKVIVVSSELDPAKQNDQVNDFIARQVDAIVLNPADSKSVGETIKHANKKGIPVFTCDIACAAKGAEVVSHVATDNYEGGCVAAVSMMEALDNKGKVVLVEHPQVESAYMRIKGFKDTLKKAKSPIEIVAEVPGNGDKGLSFAAMQDVLQAHPNVNGVFAVNDPSALGVYAALEKAGKKDVSIIGFDASPEGCQAVKDGKIHATVKQSTEDIAKGVVNVIVQYSEGEDVKQKTLIPTTIYKKSDADKDSTLK
jgi:ribose transport system substrate-binding protein